MQYSPNLLYCQNPDKVIPMQFLLLGESKKPKYQNLFFFNGFIKYQYPNYCSIQQHDNRRERTTANMWSIKKQNPYIKNTEKIHKLTRKVILNPGNKVANAALGNDFVFFGWMESLFYVVLEWALWVELN